MSPFPHQWFLLCPYGQFAHKEGGQLLDSHSAHNIVRHFKSLRSRLKRRFKRIPIFSGHPDDPVFAGKEGHADLRPYGYVKQLEARESGLWVFPKWNSLGQAAIESGRLRYFSPRWTMDLREDGLYSPRLLISIGLTNTPNIVAPALLESPLNKEDPAALKARLQVALEELARLKESLQSPQGVTALRQKSQTLHLSKAQSDNSLSHFKALNQKVLTHKKSVAEPYFIAWQRAKQRDPELFASL